MAPLIFYISLAVHLCQLVPTQASAYTITPFNRRARPSTSPSFRNTCFENIDCPPTQFCNETDSNNNDCEDEFCPGPPSQCSPRTGRGTDCTSNECQSGLYCDFNVKGSKFDQTCVPQIPKGEKCKPAISRACQDGLVCSRFKKVCDVMTMGFAGDRCFFDHDCQQEKGFYCNTVSRVCTAKGRAGENCSRASNNYVCLGFCATRGRGDNGVCVARRELGETCSFNEHCEIVRVEVDSREPVRECNNGRCAENTSLLKMPGKRCNSKRDLCDEALNLKCERIRGKNVCVQRSWQFRICTRDSQFSFCDTSQKGAPLECRRERAKTSKLPFSVDVCVQKTEILRRGQVCNRVEYALCEKGTTCVSAPGIERFVPEEGFGRLVTAYCMKTVPAGGDCSNKFDSVCEKGSFCIKDACKVAAKGPEVPITLSGVDVKCGMQKCAPGLVCVDRFGEKKCDVPTIKVKRFQPCFDTAAMRKKCESGSFCIRDPRQNSLKRCLPPSRVGGPCETDNGCKGGLKCDAGDENDAGKKCYDPKKSLSQGAACNPKTGKRGKQCVVSKNGNNRTKCLAKGKGFACQVEAELFEGCSVRRNVGCGIGQVCSSASICMPRNE